MDNGGDEGGAIAPPVAGELDVAVLAPRPIEEARPRRRRWIVPLAVVVAVLGGAAAYASTTDVWPGNEPATWDPAIEPLARFVEKTRGGTFDEPVEVVFNSREEYADHFAIERDDIDEDDEKEMERYVGTLRAIGLLAGDLDLIDTAETMGETGTLGFYNHEDRRIHVRGGKDDLDAAMRTTLVHELTHAYDFAHFDLEVDEDEFDNSGEAFGYQAVVEGSATLVQWAYVESLTEDERAEIEEDGLEEASPDQQALDGLPPYLLEDMQMPYVVGPRFLTALAVRSGSDDRRAIDRALGAWPRSEAELVDLDLYTAGKGPRKVAPPALRPDEVRTDADDWSVDFGQISLALLLAPRVGADAAWMAVQGWHGDSTSNYRRGADGPHCLRTAVAFEGAAHRSSFRSAAEAWARSLPDATVSVDEDLVVLDACDPGPDGPPVPEPEGVSLSEVLMARADLAATFVELEWPAPTAACLRDGIFGSLGVDRYLELDGRLLENGDDAEAMALLDSAFESAAAGCGVELED